MTVYIWSMRYHANPGYIVYLVDAVMYRIDGMSNRDVTNRVIICDWCD